MIGRSVNRLRSASSPDVAQIAQRLVLKWREEVQRAKGAEQARRDEAAKYLAPHAAAAPAMRPPKLSVAAAQMALLLRADAKDASPRVSELALACEAATQVLAPAACAAALSKLVAALEANESLRTALITGWLAPAEAVRLSADALHSIDFMAPSI
jgi:hypothetical protein